MKPSPLYFQNPNLLCTNPSPSMAFSFVLRILCLSIFLQPLHLRVFPSHPRLLSPFRPCLISIGASHRLAVTIKAVRCSDGNGSMTAMRDSGNESEGRVVPAELHKEATKGGHMRCQCFSVAPYPMFATA